MSKEDQETDKGFWIEKIQVPDVNGNCRGNIYTGFEGKIKVFMGKPVKEVGIFGKWSVEFKTVLPDYIHSKLVNTSITRIRDNFKSEPTTNDYNEKHFKKTISSKSLQALNERYCEIIYDFLFVLGDEKAPREKTIFVKWKFKNTKAQSHYNGALMGNNVNIDFNFFIGYYNGRSVFDINYRIFNTTYSKDEREIIDYKRITWTQEREEFFEKIYENFGSLGERLNDFFEDMNEKTIDSKIGATLKLL